MRGVDPSGRQISFAAGHSAKPFRLTKVCLGRFEIELDNGKAALRNFKRLGQPIIWISLQDRSSRRDVLVCATDVAFLAFRDCSGLVQSDSEMWIGRASDDASELIPRCGPIAVGRLTDGHAEQMEPCPALLFRVPRFLRKGKRIVEVVRGYSEVSVPPADKALDRRCAGLDRCVVRAN
ncbi:MAG: hypothetical protein ABL971_14705 [Vicinamibacterales bacterium]